MNNKYLNKQEYRPIPGLPDYYVSSDGQVASTRRGSLKLIGAPKDRYGYPKLAVRYGSEKKMVLVHAAVLMAWSRPRRDGEVTRHINNKKDDNRLINLCWGSVSENANDRAVSGIHKGCLNSQAKLNDEDVLRLRSEYKHKSLSVLCIENPDYSKFGIWAAVSGYTWGHLPGAIRRNRRCSKKAWRNGVKIRIKNETKNTR